MQFATYLVFIACVMAKRVEHAEIDMASLADSWEDLCSNYGIMYDAECAVSN